jgi:hypothetical protein
MAASDAASFDIGHPAPDRGLVGAVALVLSLAGGPTAWTLQLLAGSALGGLACRAETRVLAPDLATTWMIIVNLLSIALGLAALLLAWRNYRRTGRLGEKSHGEVMEAGEGRTHFLSIWAIWTGVTFLVAIIFNTVSVFWAGLCAL